MSSFWHLKERSNAMKKPISAHAETIRILRENNQKAKKKFGQNFIIDPSVVKKIAEVADVKEKDVIEVGPGLGALTEQLSFLANSVTAYEIDKDWIDHLNNFFVDSNVKVINQDFLTVTNDDFTASHCVGNLPYYITTPILFHILENLDQIKVITIMVQKEVADRLSAQVGTKDYNALSIILNTLCDVKTVLKVNANVFMPKPNVDSAVVQLRRKENVSSQDLSSYFSFVKKAFTQRRKTLVNNLRDVSNLKEILVDMNLSESIRAEALSKEQFEDLYKRVNA